MLNAVSPIQVAAALTELWSPRVVGEVDDAYVKVAKVHGSLTWHSHANEDEMFLVLRGRLRIEMENGTVELGEGQMFVVPKGVRHNPVAEEECLLLLIERKSTLHTGDVTTERTRTVTDQLRPIWVALTGFKLTGRAKGMSQVARDAGLSRDSLYKALSEDGNPSFATVLKVARALGVKFHAEAA
jgi:mannose-6-phosphate isomerase-like protein (cupin superfamily)